MSDSRDTSGSVKKGKEDKPYNSAKYLEYDVLVAAKARIRHALRLSSNVLVGFSGGKDSLVVLELMRQIYREDGRKDKIKVYFYDEEVIFPEVIKYVQDLVESGEFEFYYFCLPFDANMSILGGAKSYVQWCPKRGEEGRWMRDKPDYAISSIYGYPKDRVWSQYEMADALKTLVGNDFIQLTGVRAQESLKRLKSVLINKTSPHLSLGNNSVRPIYDWSEDDVFKFFYDNEIDFCDVYNQQTWAKMSYRVASAVNKEACNNGLDKAMSMYPQFFDDVFRIFPEVEVQIRYGSDKRIDSDLFNYDPSPEGLYAYVDELEGRGSVDAESKKIFLKYLKETLQYRERFISKGTRGVFGGYPYLKIYEAIRSGGILKGMQPTNETDVSPRDYEFEGLKYPEAN